MQIVAGPNNQHTVAQVLAQQALAQLQAARDAGTAVYTDLGAVPAGTMTTAVLSTVVRQMAEAQRTVIRDVLDELAKVERLLVRAVAAQYDAAD